MDPDILLMDEIMAAGDAAFQQKAGNLIQHFREQGKTIVMASHSLVTIERECTRAVLLDHGQVVADGPTEHVLDLYKERSKT